MALMVVLTVTGLAESVHRRHGLPGIDLREHIVASLDMAQAGASEQAVREMRMTLQLEYASDKPAVRMAPLVSEWGTPADRIAVYRRLAMWRADDAQAQVAAASALLTQPTVSERELQEALMYSTRAVELDPQSAAAHVNLGAALLGLRRTAEAREQYRQALAIQPELEPAQRALEYIQHGR